MIEIEWWVYLAVLGGLIAVSLLLHVIVISAAPQGSPAREFGLGALVIGTDKRTSTSKLQPLLWTYAILWALISVLASGGIEEFRDFIDKDLGDEYFLLLGGPYLVAIAAKAKTQYDVNRAVEKGKMPPKREKPEDEPSGAAARVTEIVTNDEGSVDLGDFQYLAFTLLTLTYFVWSFIASPNDGLPEIPGTLLILSGVSQATYLGKKVLIPPSETNDEGKRRGRSGARAQRGRR